MADEDRDWAKLGIDVAVPSVARMYDYGLGGKDNFAVDRELAEQVLARVPEGRDIALANRRFLGRAVEFLTKAGIRQFLDLGAGLPSQNNVHEVAQRGCPDARVVYVDYDPVVLTHANALLATDDSTVAVLEDIRNPERILAHPDVRRLLDFSQPVAVMCVAVLHFITDDADPWGLVSTLTDALVPGSAAGRRSPVSSTGSTWSSRAWPRPPTGVPTSRNGHGPVVTGCWPAWAASGSGPAAQPGCAARGRLFSCAMIVSRLPWMARVSSRDMTGDSSSPARRQRATSSAW